MDTRVAGATGWRRQVFPDSDNPLRGGFLFWTTLFACVGTFVWAIAFGLVYGWVAGADSGPVWYLRTHWEALP